jgi:hypothetical protein
MMYQPKASAPRKAAILLIVIILLTLFAVVGISFVMFAESEANASRFFRETYVVGNTGGVDDDPDTLLKFALAQLIYDVADPFTDSSGQTHIGGAYSAMRGHSLARDVYGWNTDVTGASNSAAGTNMTPFNGFGQLHYTNSFLQSDANPSPGVTAGDDFFYPNYFYFGDVVGGQKFVRDPERFQPRQDASNPLTKTPGAYYGINAPYTYPNMNHMFLAAARDDGTLLVPSFHRPYIWGPSLADTTNPNWSSMEGKYKILRPRPQENITDSSGNMRFPFPNDATGDIKNLIGAPGGNDSIWMDLGYPVKVAPNGQKFKACFAFLVQDLDNRLNVNAHGNIVGLPAPQHASGSNMGWGLWEVNAGAVLSATDTAGNSEWQNLFQGSGTKSGRYGTTSASLTDPQPSFPPHDTAAGAYAQHYYGQTDFNGINEWGGAYTPTGSIGYTNGQKYGPAYPDGYGGGFQELVHHPSLYDIFNPRYNYNDSSFSNDDMAFDITDMKKLLFGAYTGTDAQSSSIAQLCPDNFNDTHKATRNQVTTHSFDLDRPGVMPLIWDPTQQPYQMTASQLSLPGASAPAALPLPPFGVDSPSTTAPGTAPPTGSEFGTDWRMTLMGPSTIGATTNDALGRIDLARFLPPYPHMGSGQTLNTYQSGAMAAFNTMPRFDGGDSGVAQQFAWAQQARQQFADDIYRRLLKLTGVTQPANPAAPTDLELQVRRYLAQLAANIVDYIDEDDVSTPFNFYNQSDGLVVANPNNPVELYALTATGKTLPPGVLGPPNDQLLKYWVFGTELPRVVLNEVYSEYQYTVVGGVPANGPIKINIWAELFNPLATQAMLPASQQPPNVQGLDFNPVRLYVPQVDVTKPAYSPYVVTVADVGDLTNGGPLLQRPALAAGLYSNDNIQGEANNVRTQTAANEFPQQVGTVQTPTPASVNSAIGPQQYFLVGPGAPNSANDVRNTIAPPRVPGNTPWLQCTSGAMHYEPTYNAATGVWTFAGTPINDNTTGVTVLLRRLANPYLPYNQLTNPYITVDYMGKTVVGGTTDWNETVTLWNITDTSAATTTTSYGKAQPFQSSFLQPQNSPPDTSNTNHTLGKLNDGAQANYDWLVHLDRVPVDQMELLNVSGYQPYLLTQMFVAPYGPSNTPLKFAHLAPWFNDLAPWPITSSAGIVPTRLNRVFEYVRTASRMQGVPLGGREPGKVNVNDIWDSTVAATPPIFQALVDASAASLNMPGTDVDTMWGRFKTGRTAGTAPGISDRPLLGFAPAFVTGSAGTQFPNGLDINNTWLQADPTMTTGNRMFQLPVNDSTASTTNPYRRYQLLTKLANNVTTRSNVFAVWLTVGFFEADDSTVPPKLGAEIGLATNTNIRHQMFAIVDRSKLSIGAGIANIPSPITAQPGKIPGPQSVSVSALSGTTQPPPPTTQVPWQIKVGTALMIDAGSPNEEVVTVTAVGPGNKFTANFLRAHTLGPNGDPIPVTLLGNPGPQPFFDPRAAGYAPVVPYFAVIN